MRKLAQSSKKPKLGNHLSDQFRRLTSRRQEIMRPVLEHPQEYVFLSVRGLAQRLKMDPATTLRVVRTMGFRTFREFQLHLHERAIAHATLLDRMRARGTQDSNIPRHLRECLEQDLRNIHALRNTLDFKHLEGLIRRVYRAPKILILGGDLATSLVNYLEYHMTILGLPVVAATAPGRVSYISRNVGKNDLVIAISFRRGLRQTVEGLRLARSKGAYAVGITDTFISPIAKYANECLLVSVETTFFGASYAAPMSLFNVILSALASYRRQRTFALLEQAEEEQRHGFRWYQGEQGA
jgi:DNA-binding MurR/RpiR family transcriptional regulator